MYLIKHYEKRKLISTEIFPFNIQQILGLILFKLIEI